MPAFLHIFPLDRYDLTLVAKKEQRDNERDAQNVQDHRIGHEIRVRHEGAADHHRLRAAPLAPVSKRSKTDAAKQKPAE